MPCPTIDSDSACPFLTSESLPSYHGLSLLDLSGNCMGPEGASWLAEGLSLWKREDRRGSASPAGGGDGLRLIVSISDVGLGGQRRGENKGCRLEEGDGVDLTSGTALVF